MAADAAMRAKSQYFEGLFCVAACPDAGRELQLPKGALTAQWEIVVSEQTATMLLLQEASRR